ncbi:MAG: hypothetical protein V1792_22015 [Pseudomonadota bacterium]
MKRLERTRSTFFAALIMCSLCFTSSADCDELDRLIDETSAFSGLSKQLEMLTGTMVAAVPEEALSNGMSRKEIGRFMEKSAGEEALASKVRESIRLDLNREALEKVSKFYRSGLGRKVGRLQGRALIPSAIQDVTEGRNVTASLSGSRAAILKRIIRAQHVCRSNFLLLDQMVNGFADGRLGRSHDEAERIRDRFKSLVEKARTAEEHMERLALASYAHTLGPLSDKELEELAAFHESEPAEWFRVRVQKGLNEAVYMSAKALGEAITESERKGSSNRSGGR